MIYAERGLSRVWLLVVPIITVAMIVTQALLIGRAGDWWIWVIIGGLAQLFVWMQVTAGRTHVSVELTERELRCGAEAIDVEDIARILPGKAPDHGGRVKESPDRPAWLSARAMGRLHAVPRRRYGVGLELTDGAVVQAWAKNDYALRQGLEKVLPG